MRPTDISANALIRPMYESLYHSTPYSFDEYACFTSIYPIFINPPNSNFDIDTPMLPTTLSLSANTSSPTHKM